MKKYDAILFDLDGTLLPMNMDEFMKAYFKNLCVALAPYGFEPKSLVDNIWAGTAAMVKNDGKRKNGEVFWETFEKLAERDLTDAKNTCDEFYTKGFQNAKSATKENPLAKKAVELARNAAGKVVLATNPLFPRQGQLTRISWIGLSENDFDMITSYETDSYCKPNPMYYKSICERIGVAPENCLMIGNDEREDGYAASEAGLDTYLVTDCIIENEKYPCSCARGTFVEMCSFLESLAK